MEWCRMFPLRAVMCVVLLCYGLQSVVPDTMPDEQSMSSRDKKLQELLRSLDAYSTELEPKVPLTKTTSTTSPSLPPLPTVPPFLNLPDSRARVGGDPAIEDLLPNAPEIRSYQDFYKVFYGTQEGVNLLRKQYGPNGLQKARAKYGVNRNIDDLKLANDHYLKMHNRARCKTPVPQVIRVKDYYPDPSREYLPRCTLLHRCGDDTGCCDSDAFHCVPTAMQEVALHFYTLTVGKHGLNRHNSVEKLLFVNHTACHCQMINDLPRIQDGRETSNDEEPTPKSKCNECPVPFTSRIYKDGRCGCDCFDRQKPCIRIKRGREPLSEIERRCVEANHCHIPDCEYGLYEPRTGYCPRRHDEDQRGPSRKPSSNQRWAFLERD